MRTRKEVLEEWNVYELPQRCRGRVRTLRIKDNVVVEIQCYLKDDHTGLHQGEGELDDEPIAMTWRQV